MLKRLHYISVQLPALLLVLACGLVACGCSSDTDEPQPGPDPAREVVGTLSLYLNMGDSFSASRSSASRTPTDGPDGLDSYDPGSGYENYIDVSDISLYAFNGTSTAEGVTPNTFYQKITDLTLHPLYDVDGEIRRYYYISFPVTEEFKKHFETTDLKLVLLANWYGAYPAIEEGATIHDLVTSAEAVMDYKTMTPVVTADNRIPLFGVKNFGGVTSGMTSGSVKWLDDINLLRALAKVEVYDDPESPVFIESAYITRYVTRLYKAPLGVNDEGDYKTDSYASDYGPVPSIPAEPDNNYERLEKLEMKPLTTAVPDGPRHFVIYIPEYKNIGRTSDTERIRIEIHYEGLSDAKYVDFKYYNATPYLPNGAKVGDYFNINRNYWYQFSIHKDREVKVQVVPYAEVDLRPGYGLMTDKAHFIPVTVKDADGNTTIYYYDPKTGLYYDESKTNVVPNPFPGIDPVTGRYIFYDSKFNLLYYFDPDKYQYYAPDNSTKIINPYNEESYDNDSFLTKVVPSAGGIFYYYNLFTCQYFAPTNSKKEVKCKLLTDEYGIPLPAKIILTDIVTSNSYYYDALSVRYYLDESMKNEIADPFKI